MDEEIKDTKCSRERYWSEIYADEKCERLRQQVLRLQRLIGEMIRTNTLMKYHSHAIDGKVLVMIYYAAGPGSGENVLGKTKSRDVYF